MSDLEVSTRSRSNTRARLLEAAAQVIVAKGITGASVDELATAAGFTRGAFYSNYSSKEELLTDVFRSLSDRAVGIARSTLAHADADGAPEDLISALFDALAPIGATYAVIQHEYLLWANRNPVVRQQYERDTAALAGVIRSMVAQTLQRLGRRPTVPLEHLSFVLTSSYMTWLAGAAIASSPEAIMSFTRDLVPTLLDKLSEPAPTA